MRIDPKAAFQVCDVVETDYSGKATRHIIWERFLTRNGQSGVCYRVVPPVNKSGGKRAKIDHGWFRRIGSFALDPSDQLVFIRGGKE
jgi:hypothetical protein